MNKSATTDSRITVVGARVHQLKNVTVEIPLNRLTVLTGVSGSGKTSLLLGTIHAEGQRRFLETLSQSARHFLQRVERPDVDRIDRLPPTIATGQIRPGRKSLQRIGQSDDFYELLTELAVLEGVLYCPDCQLPLRRDDPQGLFERLKQLPAGTRLQLAIAVKTGSNASFSWEEQKRYWRDIGFDRFWELQNSEQKILQQLQLADSSALIVVDRLTTGRLEYSRLQESLQMAYRSGQGRVVLLTHMSQENKNPILLDDREQSWSIERLSAAYACSRCDFTCSQLQRSDYHLSSPAGGCELCRDAKDPVSDCVQCSGTGCSPLIRSMRLPGLSDDADNTDNRLQVLLRMKLGELQKSIYWRISQQQWSSNRLAETYRTLEKKLQTYLQLGLKQVCLADYGGQLSLGNWQRLQTGLAVNAGLVQSLFLFDEPTQGLHSVDIPPLLNCLQELVTQGNTVVVADNHPLLWSAADQVIELGPAAGAAGGNIVWTGTGINYLLRRQQSWANQQFSSKQTADKIDNAPKTWAIPIELNDHSAAIFPLSAGGWTTITGRCGAGKSYLLQKIREGLLTQKQLRQTHANEEEFPFAEVIEVDEQALKGNARSTPATLLKLFGEIRTLFAETGEAKSKGYRAVQFSFNSAQGGRCIRCAGRGQIELETHFLPGQSVTCPECSGTRFDAATRKITYRNRNIAELLAMSADEAFGFFRNVPGLQKKLQSLREVGLGYLPLGLPISQLSTGEQKRLKLASLLLTSPGKRYLFLFDEPSQGLHEFDLLKLRDYFLRLLEQGHSIVCADVHPLLITASTAILELPDQPQQWSELLLTARPVTEFLQNEHTLTARTVNQWREFFPG